MGLDILNLLCIIRMVPGYTGHFLEGHASTLATYPIKDSAAPSEARIVLYDIEHVIDLEVCRVRMPFRVAELMATGASGSGREIIAAAAGVDKQTFRKFLDGGHVSAESLISIIERGLGLKFADIVKPSVGKEA